MAKKIPIRPDSHANYNLTDDEMDCISWVILSGRNRKDVWVKFVMPNIKDLHKNRIQEESDEWWKQANVKRYIAEYNQTLEEYFSPQSKRNVARDREKEAEEALITFRDNVISAVNNPDVTDVETLTDQATLLNRIGMLKEEEEVQVAPVRYLPVSCSTCRYKQFIDEQIKEGNIVEDNN